MIATDIIQYAGIDKIIVNCEGKVFYGFRGDKTYDYAEGSVHKTKEDLITYLINNYEDN